MKATIILRALPHPALQGFFTEDEYDTQRNHAQHHTFNFLVVEQPGVTATSTTTPRMVSSRLR
jgi:hypothetical protein